MATLKDVAQRAGVTVTTVSRMLNDRARVSEKTRLRIQNAMEELDYHPNELARSLAKKTAILSASSFPRRTTSFSAASSPA